MNEQTAGFDDIGKVIYRYLFPDAEQLHPALKPANEGYEPPQPKFIKYIFKASGKNKKSIAASLHVTRDCVLKWETGQTKIPYATWRLFLIENSILPQYANLLLCDTCDEKIIYNTHFVDDEYAIGQCENCGRTCGLHLDLVP